MPEPKTKSKGGDCKKKGEEVLKTFETRKCVFLCSTKVLGSKTPEREMKETKAIIKKEEQNKNETNHKQ